MGIRSLVNSKTMKGRLWDTNSPTILPGMVVAEDDSISTSERGSRVTKPSITNINHSVYLVSGIAGSVGHKGELSMLPLDQYLPNVSVYTDQSITEGDILSYQPQTYNWRRGPIFSGGGFVASQTVDRSTTAGTVTGSWVPFLSPAQRQRALMEWYDDFKNYTTAHDGWVAVATGTSAAVAAGTVQGNGSVLLTSGTDDNGSGLLHGQTANAPLFPANGRAIYLEARVVVSDASSQIGFFFGATETPGATQPIPDTGTALATADHFGVWKKEGTAVWAGDSYGASAQASSPSTVAFATATTYRLRALYDGKGGIHYWVDNTSLGAAVTTSTALPVVSMAPVFHLKNSAGSSSQTCSVLSFAAISVK